MLSKYTLISSNEMSDLRCWMLDVGVLMMVAERLTRRHYDNTQPLTSDIYDHFSSRSCF